MIQGAESGEFLGRVHELLLGGHNFYGEVFRSLRLPYRPIHWTVDTRPREDSLDSREKQARVLQFVNNYRVRGHLIADLDPLATAPPPTHPELDPANLGFTIWDLERTFVTGTSLSTRPTSALTGSPLAAGGSVDRTARYIQVRQGRNSWAIGV